MLVHGCLNGTAPGYLSDLTVSVASAARRQLRSASTSDLVVPSVTYNGGLDPLVANDFNFI